MAVDDPPYDLFVSYALADAAWVEGYLLDALRQAGVRCQTEAAFTPGAPRLLELERAIRASGRTLLILSPAYLADDRTGFIDLLAQTYGHETSTWPVLPVLLEPVKLPMRLAMLTALNATDPADQPRVIERLCAELKRPAPGAVARPACPYPGMVPFRETDGARFFGREQESESLLQSLRLHPFLTVIGPSGSGKSSLVFAGLIPALHRSRLFGEGQWAVRAMRPGEKPMAALAEALGGDPADPDHTAAQAIAATPGARRLLLVIDQFEELFTVADQGAVTFQETLGRLLGAPEVYVVLTARADFYPDLMASPLWPEIKAHRAEIVALGPEGLRAAIVKPAENAGVFVEGALVERLLADAAGEPGALPMVQETLVLLWERLERRYLPLRAYEAIVISRSSYGDGAGGHLTALQVAMSRRADATLAALPPSQQAITRRVFLRLIQFGEGRADTRRQQRIADLQALGDENDLLLATLRSLAEHRLLTLGGEESGAAKVDIAHEALIAGWPTLRGWIAERREAEQTRRRVEAKAAEWAERRQSRRGGGLLDAVELKEAERWSRSPAAAELGCSDSLKKLIGASRRRVLLARGVWLLVFALVSASGVYAWIQRLDAERRSATTTLIQGLDQCNKGEIGRGLLSLARALELTPIGSAVLDREIRSNLSSWAEDLNSLEMLVPQAGEVRGAVFSPDGQSILTTNGKNASLWSVSSGVEIRTFIGHEADVNAVAISRDGLTALTGSTDGTARLWEMATGKELRRLAEHGGAVWAVAISRDGRNAATGAADGATVLWNLESGRSLRRFRGREGGISTLAFHPGGRLLLAGGDETVARLWDVESGEEVRTLVGHQQGIRAVAFSTEGDLILTGSGDGTARLWETATGKPVGPVFPHLDAVKAVAFSADGRTFLTGSADRTARLWERTGLPIGQPLRHLEDVLAVAFQPTGTAFLTGGMDRMTRVWSVPRGGPAQVRVSHPPSVESVVFSTDGGRFVTSSSDRAAALWTTATGEPVKQDFLGSGEDTPLAFSRSGRKIITENRDNSVSLWDQATKEKRLLSIPGKARVHLVVFSLDERVVFTASRDGYGRLWDSATGQSIGKSLAHEKDITCAAFSADGALILTGSLDQTARLWRLPSGEPFGAPLGHDREIYAVAISSDGRVAATGSADMTARLWKLGDDHATLAFTLPHRGTVNALAFSQDGLSILTGSGDWTARLWDTASGRPLNAPLDHSAPVLAVALGPGNGLILTGGQDKTARLWEYHTGRPIGPPLRHEGYVTSLAFSPDGRTMITGSTDGLARLWKVPSPVAGSASRHMERAEVATGMELDPGNAVEFLSAPAWAERRRQAATSHGTGQ